MTPGQVVASRPVLGPPISNHRHCFTGRLEVRAGPDGSGLPFQLWWVPNPNVYLSQRRAVLLAARPIRIEILLDLAWAATEMTRPPSLKLWRACPPKPRRRRGPSLEESARV